MLGVRVHNRGAGSARTDVRFNMDGVDIGTVHGLLVETEEVAALEWNATPGGHYLQIFLEGYEGGTKGQKIAGRGMLVVLRS